MVSSEKPILFCVCGPSGSGKSSLCQLVIEPIERLLLSVSTTTRSPRKNEKEGEHYFFVDDATFKERISQQCFIEHAMFGAHRYGTERRNIEMAADSNSDLLLDIDVQGARELKKLHPENSVVVFVVPPSFDDLKKRLHARGTEDTARQAQRLEIARSELKQLASPAISDYILVNDDLQESALRLAAVISAERLKFARQFGAFRSNYENLE